jgi:hypothetical protein
MSLCRRRAHGNVATLSAPVLCRKALRWHFGVHRRAGLKVDARATATRPCRPKEQRLSQYVGRSIPNPTAQHDDGRLRKLVERARATRCS